MWNITEPCPTCGVEMKVAPYPSSASVGWLLWGKCGRCGDRLVSKRVFADPQSAVLAVQKGEL